jgi:hypothetical protein
MVCIFVFLVYLATCNSQIIENKTHIEIPDAEFFDQRLDHFDNTNPHFWRQRYWAFEKFFNHKNGPVFLIIGGQSRVNPESFFNTSWFGMAQELNALFVLVEERFHGESRPTKYFY